MKLNLRWRRAFRIPLILLAINLAIGGLAAGVVYGYAGERQATRDRIERDLQNLNYQRDAMLIDRAYLEANQTTYDTLLDHGLLEPQDRLAAADLLERLRQQHRLNAMQYSFSPERRQAFETGPLARMTMVTTNIIIDMAGVTDLAVLSFARAVTVHLPGDVRVIGLNLQRTAPVDQELLAQLRAGDRVDLVQGHLEIEWRGLEWTARQQPVTDA